LGPFELIVVMRDSRVRHRRGAQRRSGCGQSCAALVLILAAGSACTALASGSDTLTRVDAELLPDASAPAAPVDSRWACLGDTRAADAVALRPGVELSLTVVDIGSNVPPTGLTARACNRLDVNCLTPVAANVLVASDGALHLSVAQGFDGYVELTSPNSVPTMFFFNQPVMVNAVDAFTIVNPTSLAALAASGGVAIDAQLGQLLVRTFDCEGARASGVQISNGSGGQVFSFADGLPVVGLDVTTADGIGGFVNVRPGLVFLQGIEVGSRRISGTASVVVRPNWLTYGDVEPVPP
jgi:hypothetical protein